MKNTRLFWNSVLISLPSALLVAAGIFFWIDKVPEIEKAEYDRVKSVYREAALAIRQEPEKFQTVRRTDDWKPAGKMAPGKWGFSPIRLKRLTWVWYDDGGDLIRFTDVPYVPQTDYRMLFGLFGSVFLLVLIAMTAVGVRYFVGYVKSRDDFMAATAHDLTTPLVALRHLIGRDDDEARTLNERMIRLVENIKSFMRLGGRRPAPQPSEFDLVSAFNSAYALFREDYRDLFDGRDLPLTVGTVPSDSGTVPLPSTGTVPPTPAGTVPQGTGTVPPISMGTGPVMVWADETLTLQIIWNLLGNDLKYAAPFGPVTARITIGDSPRKFGDRPHASNGDRPRVPVGDSPRHSCGDRPQVSDGDRPQGVWVRLELIDEGKGMTPREMRRAFDRYYRAKTVLESGKGGFGIGLCNAREFARAMGGELSVRTNEPHGCIFTLTLPGTRRHVRTSAGDVI